MLCKFHIKDMHMLLTIIIIQGRKVPKDMDDSPPAPTESLERVSQSTNNNNIYKLHL